MTKKGKKGKIQSIAVQAVIDQETMDELDHLAGLLDMSRSEFTSALIRFGIQDNKYIIKAVSALCSPTAIRRFRASGVSS